MHDPIKSSNQVTCHNLLQVFVALPQAAIFALINENDKRVYVAYSTRLHQRLGTIISSMFQSIWKYPAMSRDLAALELKILEKNVDKVFVKYFIDEYRKQGYTIYNETERIPLEYKFKMEIDRVRGISVFAVNKRKEKILLGKFNKLRHARWFMEYITKNNPSGNLVFKSLSYE